MVSDGVLTTSNIRLIYSRRDRNEAGSRMVRWPPFRTEMRVESLASETSRFDQANPFHHTSWLDRDQFEAEVPVSVFVNFFKTHRFLKADSPRLGRGDEAKIANEEDPALVDRFFFDALQFADKKRRERVPEVDCQRRGT